MSKTVFKIFWIWQFDREEDWLNEMATMVGSLSVLDFVNINLENLLKQNILIALSFWKVYLMIIILKSIYLFWKKLMSNI